jgi:hypothetical protein
MGRKPSLTNQQLDERIENLAKEIAETDSAEKRKAIGKKLYTARKAKRQRTGTQAGSSTGAQTESAGAGSAPSLAAPTLEFETAPAAEPKPPRTYKPRATSAKSLAEAEQKTKDEADAQAAMLLLMLDGAAVSIGGEDAKLNVIERTLIEPALARMIARIDPAKAQAISKWIDPIMILAGGSLWFVRVREMAKDQGSGGGSGPAPSAPIEPAPQNGNQQKTADLGAMKLHGEIQDYYASPERER